MDHEIDIVEQRLHDLNPGLLEILLRDNTTGEYIRWACDDYAYLGDGYTAKDQILAELITGDHTSVIRPRILKEAEAKAGRTREKAEVFTPSWVCNRQNNLVDAAWFGYTGVFNIETEAGWLPVTGKIEFPNSAEKGWRDYVLAVRMEITCGEAPYLASRYDTVTGTAIPVEERIGLLDRKLRVIGENTESREEWFEWALKALQSIYGYEFQGDNVLLARENILASVGEYYFDKFEEQLTLEKLRQAAIIVSWNIWQMNGLTYAAPYSEKSIISDQIDWFSEMGGQVEMKQEIPCIIMDWQAGETVPFETLIKER
ncbi:MAG: restriction endonuclease subunit M [Oscillospiraceae bacterium]|nr:restriction endonuclease subunit M [Oscillospiraceae bacterium]